MTEEGAPRRGISQADRRFYGALVAFWALGFAAQPVWGWVDPALPESARIYGDLDWHRVDFVGGRGDEASFRVRSYDPSDVGVLADRTTYYSFGPNGLDDGGAGDDLLLYDEASGVITVYLLIPTVTVLLGVAALVGWELRRHLRRPRLLLQHELLAATLIGLPAAAAGAWVADQGLRRGWVGPATVEKLRTAVLLPPVAIVALWAWAMVAGVLVWVRLRPRGEDEDAGTGTGTGTGISAENQG